ncbi:hypothetical protein BFJ63_vAg2045 [Fusarium oxysporum f. sp. narcissi]|uniref:Uncharacterized protein n=2 Tax=Fusarium oxysporum TaxID=5507 RepID=A0A420PS86_FUSOX|nr:hypothetical protein BFJ66_g6431 [Fusarium oxysporum f. sp. cepae]RKK95364.1 hypothetical protein BFJ71_g8388 [Fusarium oxysporum]RKL12429.1 hypothetical protein BFJ68_g7830 [Fusarium oxysporum]RYC94980.1 hypothetical protein BFJ63_vAg2045 [Fusarium oxysporum f. sp. narcissi]
MAALGGPENILSLSINVIPTAICKHFMKSITCLTATASAWTLGGYWSLFRVN